MKVVFLKRWRDVKKKDAKGFGKLHMPFTSADVPEATAKKLIKDGVAKKVEDKNAAPKTEKK